jgi:lactobin A/cerein 7B family class IIb bacteriocin
MKNLNKEELIEIEGGAIKSTVTMGFIIAGIVTFTIGVINGILRPLGCSTTE